MNRYRLYRFFLKFLHYAVLIALTIVVGFPIYWMVVVSITPSAEVYRWPLQLWPTNPTFEHYREVFTRQDLLIDRWFVNSVVVSTIITVLCVFLSSLTAYGFARLEFPGRDLIFLLLLFTLMVPGQVTLIPVFLLIRGLGWLDTYHALIWPGAVSVFGVFLLRQFFASVPRELEEAALMDGAGRFRIYWQIVLPLSRAAIVALTIFVFLGAWNDLFWPLVVLNSLELRTLPVGLTVLQGTYTQERALVMAGTVIASAPVLVFYAIFQRRIIQGVMLTGMGGR
ncbi:MULTISPECIES: carbohydrate ABC transporter permease [Caldilinea]|jgi:multiple sugar transport system permease protein|uniref:Putative ABC transporter permease protein n=1 Tax=Caldilinea aerophila (strain DSM 14535 / JCM 11387 / NBRC 104270 / STL-6-O1) TaxID=926550 RepID=I0I8U4_CALAS|nr:MULTISPECIES: carbohydrate ABC transporter permease [Caldilinea]BAM01682.1 putative ABC transporter permease protein [Caldilinea aerophila DSM 14535 = NBRC 104270]GIV73019.1 MAG: sugar ABC transporter permease [Caldilinea sp.]